MNKDIDLATEIVLERALSLSRDLDAAWQREARLIYSRLSFPQKLLEIVKSKIAKHPRILRVALKVQALLR